MTKNITSIVANGTVLLGNVAKNRDYYEWKATFFAYGTFGSGTVAYFWSPDGTTMLPIKDMGGIAVSSAANDSFNVNQCTGSKNTDRISIYATLSGATSPNLSVGYYDNN